MTKTCRRSPAKERTTADVLFGKHNRGCKSLGAAFPLEQSLSAYCGHIGGGHVPDLLLAALVAAAVAELAALLGAVLALVAGWM